MHYYQIILNNRQQVQIMQVNMKQNQVSDNKFHLTINCSLINQIINLTHKVDKLLQLHNCTMIHSNSSNIKKLSSQKSVKIMPKTRLMRSNTLALYPDNKHQQTKSKQMSSSTLLQYPQLNYRMKSSSVFNQTIFNKRHSQKIKHENQNMRIQDNQIERISCLDQQQSQGNCNIKIFVDEITNDPSMLHKLVDYGLLLRNKKQIIQKQQRQIQQKQGKLKNQHENYYQIFGRWHKNHSKYSQDQNEQNKPLSWAKKMEEESQDYTDKLTRLKQEQKMLLAIHQHKYKIKQQNIDSLKNNIKEVRQSFLLSQAEFISKIKILAKTSLKNKQTLANKQHKVDKISNRYKAKQQKIASLRSKLQQKQTNINVAIKQVKQLKAAQMQQLKTYKSKMINKSAAEKQLKQSSEKKLNGIVKQLISILEEGSTKKLEEIARHYDVSLMSRAKFNLHIEGVRRKNSSADTVPDINWAETNIKGVNQDSQNSELPKQILNKMQQQNPALKISLQQLMQIKSVQNSQIYTRAMMEHTKKTKNPKQVEETKSSQAEIFASQCQQKDRIINERAKQQKQLDGFIEELRSLLHKKNKQLQDSQNARVLMQKTLSSFVL